MLNTIEEAINAIKNGEIIIVVDDEDRENEGDFICAAETITPEIVNFMATHGRGLICASIIDERCEELGLEMMVGKNTALHETAFTVSVDLIGHGCTTGISASDRAKTIKALVNPETTAEDLGRPGHIFPLKAMKGGVLRRAGHTEAAIDFARLAGFRPAGALVEIMNEDGTMARLPDLKKVAEKFDLKLVSIKDLIAYRMEKESLIHREATIQVPTYWGTFDMIAFRQEHTNEVHFAFCKGRWKENEDVLVRVHSAPFSHDLFNLLNKPTNSFFAAFERIQKEGKGVVLMMNQDKGKEENIIHQLKKISQYQQEHKTTSLPVIGGMDDRDYGVGAQILHNLGISRIKLLSNTNKKRAGIIGYGLKIVDTVPVNIDEVNEMS